MSKNQTSSFRKIKSLDFLYEINENGTIFRNVKSKKQSKIKLDMHHSKKGYYVTFVNIKGKVKRVMIHVAVAECWLGDKPEGYEVDHIDRNSHNNDYRNLRYVTHSEQMKNRVLSDRIINQAKQNCANWTKIISKPVQIVKDDVKLEFESNTACAKYLAKEYNKAVEQIRYKLKRKRSHIYDYDIIYLECRD